MNPSPENESPTVVPHTTGLRRFIYITIGLLFLSLGVVGVILPVLPTTPFLLLASFFFVRSSPRLNRWLLRSRIFGPFLRDWHEKHGIRRSVRWTALVMIAIAVAGSIYFGKLPWYLIVLLCTLGVIGVVVVLRLPVIDETTVRRTEIQ